jgi:E2F transcription factor CC-MB domain
LRDAVEGLRHQESELDKYLDFLSRQAGVFSPTGVSARTGDYPSYIPLGLENAARYMYVIYQDITSLPMYRTDTIIGIKAPSGTSLEVPDPDQGMRPGMRRFQMYLSSRAVYGPDSRGGGPINVYLIRPKASGGHQEDTPVEVEEPLRFVERPRIDYRRDEADQKRHYTRSMDSDPRYERPRLDYDSGPDDAEPKRPYTRSSKESDAATEPTAWEPPHDPRYRESRRSSKESEKAEEDPLEEEEDSADTSASADSTSPTRRSRSASIMPRSTPERPLDEEESSPLYSRKASPSGYEPSREHQLRDSPLSRAILYEGTPQRASSPSSRHYVPHGCRTPSTPHGPPSLGAHTPHSAQYDLMNMPLQSPRGYRIPPRGYFHSPGPGPMHSGFTPPPQVGREYMRPDMFSSPPSRGDARGDPGYADHVQVDERRSSWRHSPKRSDTMEHSRTSKPHCR